MDYIGKSIPATTGLRAIAMINLNKIKKIEIREFQTRCETRLFLLIYEQRNFEVNGAIVRLLESLQQASSFELAFEHYKGSCSGEISFDKFEELVTTYIAPVVASETTQQTPFIYRKELLTSQTISRFTQLFKKFFDLKQVLLLGVIIVFFELLFFISSSSLGGTPKVLDIYTIIFVMAMFIVSSLFHELGHASACDYFGVEHGGIGFGLYLNFPAFYTDVSKVWRLSLNKRLIVNFAGIYFQLLLLIPFIGIYYFTKSDLLFFFITAININLLITLNPFFKFDGYWIMTDLLGVPNLRERSKEYFKYLFRKIIGRPMVNKPFILKIKKTYRIFIVIYTLLVNTFFAFYFLYIIPKFLLGFFQNFPSLIRRLTLELSIGVTPDFALIKSIFTQFVFFCLVIFILYRTLKPLILKVKRKIS